MSINNGIKNISGAIFACSVSENSGTDRIHGSTEGTMKKIEENTSSRKRITSQDISLNQMNKKKSRNSRSKSDHSVQHDSQADSITNSNADEKPTESNNFLTIDEDQVENLLNVLKIMIIDPEKASDSS